MFVQINEEYFENHERLTLGLIRHKIIIKIRVCGWMWLLIAIIMMIYQMSWHQFDYWWLTLSKKWRSKTSLKWTMISCYRLQLNGRLKSVVEKCVRNRVVQFNFLHPLAFMRVKLFWICWRIFLEKSRFYSWTHKT